MHLPNLLNKCWFLTGIYTIENRTTAVRERQWLFRKCRRRGPFGLSPDKSGGLNGSTQHFLEVYSQESENLKSLAGVDLSAALPCSDPTESLAVVGYGDSLGLPEAVLENGQVVVRTKRKEFCL